MCHQQIEVAIIVDVGQCCTHRLVRTSNAQLSGDIGEIEDSIAVNIPIVAVQ